MFTQEAEPGQSCEPSAHSSISKNGTRVYVVSYWIVIMIVEKRKSLTNKVFWSRTNFSSLYAAFVECR